MLVGEWLQFARKKAAGHTVQSDDTGLELQILLAHITGRPRAWIMAHPEAALQPAQVDRLTGLLARYEAGEPLPYLIGHWEFYGLDFEVTPAVLIPRPETELLVETGLAWLQRHPAMRLAADVGTGSGCIAISLAKHISDLKLIAVDRSWQALQVARRNASRHAVSGQTRFLLGDLLAAFTRPFDLVCANLPYIPETALNGLPVAKHEPRLALDGGSDGLAAIRALLKDAPRWLAPQGMALLEMQYDQEEAIACLARSYLTHAKVEILPDLAGLPRVVAIENGKG